VCVCVSTRRDHGLLLGRKNQSVFVRSVYREDYNGFFSRGVWSDGLALVGISVYYWWSNRDIRIVVEYESTPPDLARVRTMYGSCECVGSSASVTFWPENDRSDEVNLRAHEARWIQFSVPVHTISYTCDNKTVKRTFPVEDASDWWSVQLYHDENTSSDCSDFAETVLIYRRSEDGGETWSEVRQLVEPEANAKTLCGSPLVIGNVAPVQLGADSEYYPGRILAPHMRNNYAAWVTYSDDGTQFVWTLHTRTSSS